MIKIFVFCFIVMMAGCTTPSIYNSNAPADSGGDAQRHLTERYNDVRVNCGKTSQPAFLCNGVMLRATAHSAAYHSWDASPASHASGGVSFSYLRKDARYNKLAYGYVNGYIYLPVFFAGNKLTPEVLCSFPIDAGTNNRADKGCGAVPSISGSGPCQDQGIYTAAAWYSHYKSVTSSPHSHQCGFNVRDALDSGATTAFDASVKAMDLMGNESFNQQNELRLQVWADGLGAQLPLEAFFYLSGSTKGRQDAQSDQLDFKNTTGLSIPIISMSLPQTTAASATFSYVPGDQVVPLSDTGEDCPVPGNGPCVLP